MTFSKRDFLRLGGSAAIALVAAASPATFNLDGFLPVLAVESARAKDGNNGNGNGNGNGGGNGSGNSGSNGNSGSGNSAGGSSSNGAGSSASSSASASQESGATATEASDGSIDVRHANGITETLRRGRYVMKDGKGRTIISRQATANDARRLGRYVR